MTPEEEIKIRTAWGDHVILRGMPDFIDRRFRLPIDNEVSSFVAQDDVPKSAMVSSYEFILEKTARRYDELTGFRYTEFTISCQGVIVYRDWKNIYDT